MRLIKKYIILAWMVSMGAILEGNRVVGTKPIGGEPKANQSSDVNKKVEVLLRRVVSEEVNPSDEEESKMSAPDSKRSRVELFCGIRREKPIAEINVEYSFADYLCDRGKRYFCGVGVSINRECAKKCFEQAARLGSKRALVYLVLYYYSGPSETQNAEKVEEYFRKAMPFVMEKIKKGDAEYECFFGYIKEHGLGGQSKNISEAVDWYRKAAMKGNADALNNLGVCYHVGKGVSKNYSIARTYYEKAVMSGNITAQYNLGCYYEDMKIYTTAVYWLRLAAARGYAKAQNKMGEFCERGLGMPYNYAEAVYWYKKAVEQGDDRAQFNLMMIQLPGHGGRK